MTATAPAPIVAVRVAEPGLRHDLRAVKVVWQRELIRFSQDRTRLVAALVQPVLYLFVLGTGLSTLTAGATGGLDLRTFLFPGVLATSVLFTAVFSAVSIVWDREFGFLREMLVAPVRRGSILVGKSLGGATVATAQGMLVVALGPLVGVRYNVALIATIVVELLLLSFLLTSFGLVLAARIQQMQAVMGIMQVLLLPLSFLSGALYPIHDLPTWMNVIVHLNPITYGVHAIRNAVFRHIDAPAEAVAKLNPPLEVFGRVVPDVVCMAIVLGSGLILLMVAIFQFNRTE